MKEKKNTQKLLFNFSTKKKLRSKRTIDREKEKKSCKISVIVGLGLFLSSSRNYTVLEKKKKNNIHELKKYSLGVFQYGMDGVYRECIQNL